MSFPIFVSKDTCPIDCDRTFSADTYDDYTDACAAFDTTISYAVPADHYVDCVYIGLHGASTNSGNMWALWVDCDWSGTQSGVYFPVRISVQGGGTTPDAFIQFQNNAIEYLFYFSGATVAYIDSGAVGGSQDKKLHVSVNGTGYYIPLYTA